MGPSVPLREKLPTPDALPPPLRPERVHRGLLRQFPQEPAALCANLSLGASVLADGRCHNPSRGLPFFCDGRRYRRPLIYIKERTIGIM